MTASGGPGPGGPGGLADLGAMISVLAALPAQVAGREGKAIREHVERLAQILGTEGPGQGSDGSDDELRGRAAAELDQLVTAVGQLAGRSKPGKRPAPGLDLGQLAAGLRTFAEFLRAPTQAHQAEVEQMVATLQGTAVPRPVPLDQLDLDGTVAELAHESARRHGLSGADARRAVERMKREMSALVRQLELRAQQEASRARTAADMERLLGSVVQTGTPLGQALDPERAAILDVFRRVDLAHMAEGLRVFGEWLSTPGPDAAAHVAVLKARLGETLGPPTTGDPGRSEAERRADFEREIKVAADEIFRGSGPGTGTGGTGSGGAGPAQ